MAAFSLYLALLHHLEPPDILKQKLPNLIYCTNNNNNNNQDNNFNILISANAFDIETVVSEPSIRSRFSSECADVVVGNPPWGSPTSQDKETRKAAEKAMQWCETNDKAVGDTELSQAFIHLSDSLLRKDGHVGLLVSTGVFFKRHNNSQIFRQQWLSTSTLKLVVNFSIVRDFFFNNAIAPFAAVIFQKGTIPEKNHRFRYYSAKRSAVVEGQQVVRLDCSDLRFVHQASFLDDEVLWKIYFWGSHRDEALIRTLQMETTLDYLIDPEKNHPERMGEGLKVTRKNRRIVGWLQKYKQLPTKDFERYGPLPHNQFVPAPADVERERWPELFESRRLLVKRGITQKSGANGQIVSRLEKETFCFRHSIYCFRLDTRSENDAKTILGITWSSLARYYLWMTSGSWGMWHHELRLEDIKNLPIRLPVDESGQKRICDIVDKLRSLDTTVEDIYAPSGYQSKSQVGRITRELESKLDEAIFELYNLNEAEQDLILDMCDIGLEYFYRGNKSDATKPVNLNQGHRFGCHSDIPANRNEQQGLDGYIHVFLESWNIQLPHDARFCWQIICSSMSSLMLAVVFSVYSSDEVYPVPKQEDENAWADLLKQLAVNSKHQFGTNRIYIDGIVT